MRQSYLSAVGVAVDFVLPLCLVEEWPCLLEEWPCLELLDEWPCLELLDE